MPEFSPGEVKTAVAPMTNPTVKAFDYTGFLYMGTDLAVMSQVDFHLEAGEQKDISLPVTMPLGEGIYPVYIGVFSAGENIALYRAIEDVTIVSAVPAVGISGVSWETVDYGYTDDWGNPEIAKFYKAEISITSDQAFTGRIILSCPNIISPVSLMTENTYQQLLQEIDDLIANTTGTIQQLWIDRKGIALQFPSVDGFRIDYRWWANWDQRFRDWVKASTDSLVWQGIGISEGTNTIYVGFFKNQYAAVGINPIQISLYSDETLLDTVSSYLEPPENVPQVLSVDIPPVPLGGGQVKPTITVRLPELRKNSQVYIFRAWTGPALGYYMGIRVAEIKYMSKSLVAKRVTLGCSPTTYIALDAPDDTYVIKGIWVGWKGVWEYPVADLSRGVYPVQAKVESWKVGVESDGCGVYWYGEPTNYNFGIVGQLTVT